MTTRWKSKQRKPKRRKAEEWICHDWPNCTCARASQYSTKPLHQYTTGAKDGFEIADSFVILRCMADHANDPKVRREALGQLIHPKYDAYHRPEQGLRWLFERMQQRGQG
jgi:hypothetical protein